MTETELQKLARERTASHPRRLSKNAAIRSDNDYIGIIAEKVVADYLHLPIQDYITPGKTDPGYDFVTENGIKIDVKGTDLVKGNLLVPCDSKMTADVYVFVVVDKSTESGTIIGWALHQEVVAAPKKDFGRKDRGAVYFVHTSKLHPVETMPK